MKILLMFTCTTQYLLKLVLALAMNYKVSQYHYTWPLLCYLVLPRLDIENLLVAQCLYSTFVKVHFSLQCDTSYLVILLVLVGTTKLGYLLMRLAFGPFLPSNPAGIYSPGRNELLSKIHRSEGVNVPIMSLRCLSQIGEEMKCKKMK